MNKTSKILLIIGAIIFAGLTALYFLDAQMFDKIMPFDTDPTDCCMQDPAAQ